VFNSSGDNKNWIYLNIRYGDFSVDDCIFFFYFTFIFYCLGTFSNFAGYECVDYYRFINANGVRISNCSFLDLKSRAIYVHGESAKTDITNCFFKNLSHNNYWSIGYNMDSSSSSSSFSSSSSSSSSSYIDYNFSGNTFVNVSSNDSTVLLAGYFKSLSFSNNSFINITCTNNRGGVSLFYFILFISNILRNLC
jgi:hypothetical protein